MRTTETGRAHEDGTVIRALAPDDYEVIISAVNDWWGGRQMRDMLPKLFFIHFCNTSYVVEHGGEIIGFLVGFVSQCHPEQAYIHFAGVHPQHRERKLGRSLYMHFFDKVAGLGCRSVHCVTSPVNTGSISFHRAMGFRAEQGMDYDGPGEHRVRFARPL